MQNKRDLATWLVTYRPQIENRMNECLGTAAPESGGARDRSASPLPDVHRRGPGA